MNKDIIKDSINCLSNAKLNDTTYEVARDIVLDYITNLQEENERYKKIFEGKERFSKIMPDDIDFIVLSKVDYDRQQEDIELTAIELKSRIDKAIEYINSKVAVYAFNNKKLPHWEFEDDNIEHLLNILQGSDNNE